jgi:hypothetical protein
LGPNPHNPASSLRPFGFPPHSLSAQTQIGERARTSRCEKGKRGVVAGRREAGTKLPRTGVLAPAGDRQSAPEVAEVGTAQFPVRVGQYE